MSPAAYSKSGTVTEMTEVVPVHNAQRLMPKLGGVQSALNSSLEMLQRESRRSTFGCVTDKD